jgi:hypothetical protein
MQALSEAELKSIAQARNVTYEPLPSTDPLTVASRMSREFPISRQFAYDAFSDPATHVRLFSIIRGSTTIPKEGIAKIVPPNQFYVLEHVEEQDVTPRLMFIRYTLNPPDTILKEGVPDPFGELEALGGAAVAPPATRKAGVRDRQRRQGTKGKVVPMDKKKAKVMMKFDELAAYRTRVTIESEFQATTGAIFMRGLIDHIWLNFFENLMIETRELTPAERRTRP